MPLDKMATTADLRAEHAASTVPATKPALSPTPPNEVLSMIASECAPADLKNMRLASKLFHQVSTEPFARKKFSRRRFIFTYQSMKALVDITAHPVLGPHLTCITFGTHRMDGVDENQIQTEQTADHNDELVKFDIFEAMHRAFMKNNHHVKMLTLALKNLKQCHNIRVFLGLHDDLHQGEAKRRGYAFKASYQGFEPQQLAIIDTLNAVMEAGRRSEYPLRTMKMCLSSCTGSLQSLKRYNSDTMQSLLQNMRYGGDARIDLHLNVWKYTSYSKLKILSDFTRVELSRYSFGEWANTVPLLRFNTAIYGTIWRAIELNALQSIFIETSDAAYDQLVEFPQHHGRSLRTLELRQVHMFAFEPPTALALKFLRFLRSHLELTRLSIEEFEVGTTIMIPEWGKMVYEGKDNVVEGLDNLIEEVDETYMDGSGSESESESEWKLE